MAIQKLNNAKKYQEKALKELSQINNLLKIDALYLCASRCYYAVFYSLKALLESIGKKTSSHKQTQIEFRKNFIKTEKIDKKYSETLTELSETRSKADYDIYWVTSKPFVERLAEKTKDFVREVLGLI